MNMNMDIAISLALVLTKSVVNNLWYLLVNNRDTSFISPRENPIIPEDIIMLEILSRLPVKSLMQFQCVCKSWRSLISRDPGLIKSHLARTSIDSNNDWLIVRCKSSLPDAELKLKHPLQSSDMRLAGTFNGLVCVYRYDWKLKSVPCIGIWNPATHQYKDVPPPLYACDIDITDFSLAFGFDTIKNDYKVIYITKQSSRLVADVYSCNAAGSWANINVFSTFILENGKLFGHAINVGESVYWKYTTKGNCHVISFDIRYQVLRLFNTPDYMPNDMRAMVNFRNFLAFLSHDWVETTYVHVYVLNETMSSTWSEMYTFGPICLASQMHINQCFRNGDLCFTDDYQCKLVCLDPETHAVLDSSIYAFDTPCLSSAYGLGYTQTLVSVMGMKHLNTNQECDRLLFI